MTSSSHLHAVGISSLLPRFCPHSASMSSVSRFDPFRFPLSGLLRIKISDLNSKNIIHKISIENLCKTPRFNRHRPTFLHTCSKSALFTSLFTFTPPVDLHQRVSALVEFTCRIWPFTRIGFSPTPHFLHNCSRSDLL